MFGSKKAVLGALVATSALACAMAFAAEPATPVAKPYPLSTCIVSGEKLGGMGAPSSIVYEGQEYKFCCPDCPAMFSKDPAKYAAKLKAASATTQPSS